MAAIISFVVGSVTMLHWPKRSFRRLVAVLVLALVFLPVPRLAFAAGGHHLSAVPSQIAVDQAGDHEAFRKTHCPEHTGSHGKCCVTCTTAAADLTAATAAVDAPASVLQAHVPSLHSSLIVSLLIRPPRFA